MTDAAAAARAAARDRRQRRQIRWLVPIGVLLLRALGRTWRVRVRGRESSERLRSVGTPFIYAFWHGEMLPLLLAHRGEGAAVLISSHHDGEIVAQIATRLGLTTVRGSSTRGGARALLGLVQALESGRTVAVTPDGPRGPAHAFAPGALVAAQRAGAPIVPIAVRASRAWRLRSWDRFLIPKPFARVSIAYGEPARVEAASAREAPSEAARFEGLLAAAGDAADRALAGW
ncbi:MAG: lysophospholipid acyltransferase family protein [Gemmatimonadaceae bacterium]